MPKPEDVKRDDNGSELDGLLFRRFSALSNCLTDVANGGGYAVYCRYKVGGYWQTVAKRIEPGTQAFQVAFGRGRTIGSALRDLNAAIANKGWHTDKPFNGE